jgi:NADH:ubiquinone oxidoreductase subunit 6 (subunit J)
MMTLPFVLLSLVTIGSAIAAVTLRNLVHCALSLTVTFAGVAGLYLLLGAQFVGFAQILVYIGAVAILVVFAILLTRSSTTEAGESRVSAGWVWNLGIALAVFGTIATAVLWSPDRSGGSPALAHAPVREIGVELMGRHVLALELIGLLLTAALIGAVVLAMKDPPGGPK